MRLAGCSEWPARLVPGAVPEQQQVRGPEQVRAEQQVPPAEAEEAVPLVELVQPQVGVVVQLPGQLVLPVAEAVQQVLVLPEEPAEASAGIERRTAGAEEEFA